MNKIESKDRKGYALLIGVNELSEEHYLGWRGYLRSCEADARAMSALLKSIGYRGVSQEEPSVLTSDKATRAGVLDALNAMALAMSDQDTGVIFFSGHGGRIPDLDGDEHQEKMDQTWCLHDGMFIDDEIAAMLTAFAPDSRVILVSDSCYSGDIARHRLLKSGDEAVVRNAAKFMDARRSLLVYRANSEAYGQWAQAAAVTRQNQSINASVGMLSACQPNQTTSAGAVLSDFSQSLLTACLDLSVDSYDKLALRVRAQLPAAQRPVFRFGQKFLRDSISRRPFAF